MNGLAGTPTDKLSVNHFIEFARETPDSIAGKSVFAVGHPKLGLKKWSTGEAYEAQGNWFLSNQFTLPGSSGSPILNANGKIVGIHHRGGRDHDDITQYGIRHESIGTASAPIMDLIAKMEKEDAPGLALLSDVDEFVSKEKFLANSAMFLRAHRSEISMETAAEANGAANLTNAKVHPSSVLAEYIDSELAKTAAAQSADDLYEFTSMANDSIYWLDCKARTAENSYKICPSEQDQKMWLDRMGKLFQRVKDGTGERDYFWVAESAYVLGKDERAGNESATKAIVDHADGRMDFNTASYLSMYSDKSPPKVGNTDVRDYLLNFSAVPHHEHHFRAIVNGLGQLYDRELISREDLQSRLNGIIADTKITLGERLRAERIAYRYGLLK